MSVQKGKNASHVMFIDITSLAIMRKAKRYLHFLVCRGSLTSALMQYQRLINTATVKW